MTDTEIVQRIAEILAQRQTSTGVEPTQLTLKEKWQQAALAWLANPDNTTTIDSSGVEVAINFKKANPHVFVVGPPQVEADASNPGHYNVQLSFQLAPFVTGTSAPSPMPQTDSTQGADGVGFPGSNPPVGIDAATLSAAKAGDTLVGTDGVAKTKRVQATMMGNEIFWQ